MAPAREETAGLAELHREHAARLEEEYGRAIAAAGLDALVIHAGVARRKSRFDDQDWPLVPTPAFTHWLPLREPECVLLLAPGRRPRLLRAREDSYWEGAPPLEGEELLAAFDVALLPPDRIAAELPAGGRLGFVGEAEERAAAFGVPPERRNPEPLLARLDAVRARKSRYERRCIAGANRRAARGHARAFEAFREGGRSELELHLLYLAATGQDDADAPYKGIVALGRNAAVLHHTFYGREPAGEPASLLIDAGATFMGYASDVTRTEVRGGGEGADLFAELIRRVDALQAEAVSLMRPGLAYEELHDRAHELLARVLVDLGLARAGVAEAELVERGVTRRFFPHGLGHSLGIQVHDVGCRPRPPAAQNPYLRTTATLAPGMVLTVEPGCYFIDALLDPLRSAPEGRLLDFERVDLLRPFGGVRVEDDVAVLEDGVDNLTRSAFAGDPG